jgi:hypothetical protein
MTTAADDLFPVGNVSFLPAESAQNGWRWDVQPENQKRVGIPFTMRWTRSAAGNCLRHSVF